MTSPVLIIEIRPRLQVCHVFVKATRVEVVDIESGSMILTYQGHRLKITIPGVELKSNSVANFTLLDWNEGAYFRVQTARCSLPQLPAVNLFDYNAKNTSYVPGVVVGVCSQLECKCCGATLTETLCFQRILPLPSDSWDSSEMFCHAHAPPASISARPADLLYGPYNFILPARSTALTNVNLGTRVVHCDQCASWLGIRSGPHYTLWNSTVRFSPVNRLVSGETRNGVEQRDEGYNTGVLVSGETRNGVEQRDEGYNTGVLVSGETRNGVEQGDEGYNKGVVVSGETRNGVEQGDESPNTGVRQNSPNSGRVNGVEQAEEDSICDLKVIQSLPVRGVILPSDTGEKNVEGQDVSLDRKELDIRSDCQSEMKRKAIIHSEGRNSEAAVGRNCDASSEELARTEDKVREMNLNSKSNETSSITQLRATKSCQNEKIIDSQSIHVQDEEKLADTTEKASSGNRLQERQSEARNRPQETSSSQEIESGNKLLRSESKNRSQGITLRDSQLPPAKTLDETALSDFVSVVRENIGINSKILVHCQVSDESEQYLLLWVMDRNLALCTWRGGTAQMTTVMKVLYSYAKDRPDPAWSKDLSLAHVSVSKRMFLSAVRHIREQGQNTPSTFRSVYDMQVSYIVLS